jgi:hypothetical protein
VGMEQIDAEVVETVAGVARLLRRAAELAWMRSDAAGPRSWRQLLALGIDSAADEALGVLPRRARLDGPTPVGTTQLSFSLQRTSCCAGSVSWVHHRGCWACGRSSPSWCGRRTQVPASDRHTIGELLADSDALARETLLDATPENAPAMVRSWNQLVASAVHLWAALASGPDSMSGLDPMERLRAVGQAIGRSVRAGHWPGHGPTDDHLSEISDNLSRFPGRGISSSATTALPTQRTRTDMPTPPIFTAR